MNWEFLTYKGAGIQMQPSSPKMSPLNPVEGLSCFGLFQKTLRKGFKSKVFIWEVNETPRVSGKKTQGEKEASKRYAIRLVTNVGKRVHWGALCRTGTSG
jgi:hypothetical protein